MCDCCVGDAVWHAGDRFRRLAEEHHLQTLRSQQQTDRLVLAGQTAHQTLFTQILSEQKYDDFDFICLFVCSL